MRSAIIGFVAGVGWLQMQASLPTLFMMALLLAAAIALALAGIRVSTTQRKLTLWVVAGALMGFVWAAAFALYHLSEELPAELEGQDITVVGTIDSLPYRFERGTRFNFAVERAEGADRHEIELPSRIALSWYAGYGADEDQSSGTATVLPGERWRLTIRLRRPHGNANPHSFDYEAWLLEQNLRATGYVRDDSRALHRNRRLDAFVPGVKNLVERARHGLQGKILSALQDKAYAGVIVALVVGDQRSIAQSDWAVFNRSGVGHLVSISGLHITMIAGLFAAIVSWLWRHSFFTGMQLPLLLPAQKAAALAGAAAALLYVALAGFGIPAQRTLYMLVVVAAAMWSGRVASVSSILCLALAFVLLLDPWAVLWPGFWLSFFAVAVILFVSTGRGSRQADELSVERSNKAAGILAAARLQWAITLGLLPLTMLLFGQVSLVSPVANAIAIPLISFVVTPLSLIGSFLPHPFGSVLLTAAHALIEWLATILGALTAWRFAVWTAPVPQWWMFACALLGTIWLLAPRGWPMHWMGVLAWGPLLVNVPTHPAAGEMWATAFDVGQGMAVLVETERHRLLYDTGPVYTPEADGGNRVILPYLKGRGISELDAVMISHHDNDHSGGALSIFRDLKVNQTFSSLEQDSIVVRHAPNHIRCLSGQTWKWDGVQFEVLFPSGESYTQKTARPNTRSCTLKVTVGDHALLLPGDIEAAQEKELIESGMRNLGASVLLAPHHGSGTSSTLAFLKAVSPKMAVFQVGYRNRYRHPKQEVYERYAELGIDRLRNDESGAIELRFGQSIDVSEYRKQAPRYWRDR